MTSLQSLALDIEQKAMEKEKTTAVPVTLEMLSFPALSRMESGLTPQLTSDSSVVFVSLVLISPCYLKLWSLV